MFKKLCIGLLAVIFLSTGLSFAVSPKAEDAMKLLKSTVPAVRRGAAARLAGMRSREAVPSLIEALEDEDFGVRTNAADALGNLRDRRAVDPLIEALKDNNRGVRISVVVALGFLRDKRAVEPLIKILKKDENEGVRISAAQVLGVLADKRAVKPLIDSLSSKEDRVRVQSAKSLGRLGATEAAGPLTKIANNSKEPKNLRISAVESLGEMNTAESMKTLKKLLKSDDIEMAINAASSLGKLGSDKGLSIALEGIESDAVNIRRKSIMAISFIGVKRDDVVQAIKKALKDEDSRVRDGAKYTVISLGIVIEKETKEKE